MSGLIKVVVGNIADLEVDAIVNAANMFMLGGGGVDGAIHAAAGEQLLHACEDLPKLEQGIRCRTSEVRVTPGFNLPAKFVIHTVGPIYIDGNHGEDLRLGDCYKNCLDAARIYGCRSIAFPSISTGVFEYPARDAAMTAYSTVFNYLAKSEAYIDVTFCCYDAKTAEYYKSLNNDTDIKLVPSTNPGHPKSEESVKATSDSDLTLYAALHKLPKCPICGKDPKILVFPQADGAKCVIQCKPWWRKAHMRVESCAAEGWWAQTKAKKDWFDAVKFINGISRIVGKP